MAIMIWRNSLLSVM